MAEREKLRNTKTLTAALLLIAGAGALTLAAICAPNVLQLLRPLLISGRGRHYYKRQRIRLALKRLAERRLVKLYQEGSTLRIEITEEGKRRIREFDFENLTLLQNKHWDGKWRVIIFDIPEKFKKARHAFHAKLKEVGFYPLQKSVFVFPFDCRDEIDFMASFCEIRHHVHYLEAADLDKKEGIARKFFNLL